MKKKQAPNFLFIMADQLAANALSFYGNQTSKTPTLNKLAKEGVVFENCYCNLPMCGPSRASLHTGRMPFSIGMYDNASEYRSSIPSFAHYLRDVVNLVADVFLVLLFICIWIFTLVEILVKSIELQLPSQVGLEVGCRVHL